MTRHFPPAPSTERTSTTGSWRSCSGGLAPASHPSTSLIKSLPTDATAGAASSIEEISKLTSTRSVGGAKVGVDAGARPAKGGRTLRNRQSVKTKLAELKSCLLEMNDLRAAGALLGWDHATYMPKYGAVARARQVATVSKLIHEKVGRPKPR